MVYRKFQPVLVLIVVVLFFVQGCAGRAAHPVQVAQPGDNKKTCKSLRKETKKISQKVKKRLNYMKLILIRSHQLKWMH